MRWLAVSVTLAPSADSNWTNWRWSLRSRSRKRRTGLKTSWPCSSIDWTRSPTDSSDSFLTAPLSVNTVDSGGKQPPCRAACDDSVKAKTKKNKNLVRIAVLCQLRRDPVLLREPDKFKRLILSPTATTSTSWFFDSQTRVWYFTCLFYG